MKNNELINSLDQLERERGIDRETLLEAIEESLQTAARKAVCASREVSVKVNRQTGAIQCWAKLLIVDKVEHPEDEIALKKVQEKYPERNYTTANLGEEIEWEVKSEDFGRIAAQNAKQIIVQKLRQAEKKNICESYRDQVNTLITGEVRRIDRNEIDIIFDQAEGAMRHGDKIPGEEYEIGDMHHIGCNALFIGFMGKRTYHVIGLESGNLKYGYAVGLKYLLDYRDGFTYNLGGLLTLCLVLLIELMAECAALGIERYTYMGWFLLGQNLLKGVYKAQYGRCVEPFGVNSGCLEESIVSPVYQSISI